jgi:hypothetical protein
MPHGTAGTVSSSPDESPPAPSVGLSRTQ